MNKVQELLDEPDLLASSTSSVDQSLSEKEQSGVELAADGGLQVIPVNVSTSCPRPSTRLHGIKAMHLLYSDAENPLPQNDLTDLNHIYNQLDTKTLEQMFSVKREVLTEAILESEKRFRSIIEQYHFEESAVLRLIKDCDLVNAPKGFVIDLCESIITNFDPLMSSDAKLDQSLQDKLSTKLFKIPFIHERCEAMVFCLNFEEEYLRMKSDLNALRDLAISISTSKELKRFFLHLLAVANFLNYENASGWTVTFHVDNLCEILQTKTNVVGKSLIDVLVEHLQVKEPQVLSMIERLPSYAHQSLAYTQISERSLALRKGFQKIFSYIQLQNPRGCLLRFVVSNRIREKLDELALALNAYKCQDSDDDNFWRHFGIHHTSSEYIKIFARLREAIAGALDRRGRRELQMKPDEVEEEHEISQQDSRKDTPLVVWLKQNKLEGFQSALETRSLSLEDLKKSSKLDFLDESVSLQEKRRFQKALNILRKGAAREPGESTINDENVVQIYSDLMLRGGKRDTIIQKKELVEGWVHVKFKSSRHYELSYVRVSRNLMVCSRVVPSFTEHPQSINDTDEFSDSRTSICLDGAAIIDLDRCFCVHQST
eukprot:767454-Hanusia_phi.AAC.4